MKSSQAMREQEPAALRPKCVLVVEDEFLVRMMLSEELRDCGFLVIEAASADEALVILEASAPDLIISDVKMPGSIDGLGLLAVVRRSFATLPVIIISAHLEAAHALGDGATRFVPKPFSLQTLSALVRRELDPRPS
jgi:DNA-binding NtrC family response regulator